MNLFYQLTIASARPGHLPALVTNFGEVAKPGGITGIISAWTSESGELNKLYALRAHTADFDAGQALAPSGDHAGWNDFRARAKPLLDGFDQITLQATRPVHLEPGCPLIDLRLYQIAPFEADTYVAHLVNALPVREKYSRNLLISQPVSADRQRVISMWQYESFEHRAQVRRAMGKDPDWQMYLAAVFPLLQVQRSALLQSIV